MFLQRRKQPLLTACVLAAATMTGINCSNGSESTESGNPTVTNPYAATSIPSTVKTQTYDIVAYGGTPSGIMAAVQASRQGQKVMLIEPTPWIGGMVTGGLSETDSGTWEVIGGLALEFFQKTTALELPRGGSPVESTGVVFNVEPHIAEQVFLSMLSDAGVTYRVGTPLADVQKSNTTITTIALTDGSIYAAKVFIDSSYEGDLMALAKVPYTVGREARSAIEPDAGVQTPYLISNGIDPYVTAGDAASGLLFEVTNGPAPAPGGSDSHVMAYNYRFCATDMATHAANAVPFSQLAPANYTAEAYTAVRRIINSIAATQSGEDIARHFFSPAYYVDGTTEVLTPYADGKFDINGNDFYSTDVVELPDQYPNGSWTLRKQIAAQIQSYDKGLFYYLATSPNVPASVSAFMNKFGLCKDEFIPNDNLPTQLYVREGRRMQGAYVMTEADVLDEVTPEPTDVIGVGGYNMDSHNHQILNLSGKLYAEGDAKASIGYGCNSVGVCKIQEGMPFRIPYGALTPAASDATNLLVSVTISATSMAYRATRLEPQYMIMGQAAGAAAALAIKDATTVQAVPYSDLEQILLNPNVASQPAQILARPCLLKGNLYPNGKVITTYKPTSTPNSCSTQVFTCDHGTWENPSNISPDAYYPACT